MADRYWVGSHANWNVAANWAATPGGAGGETVPTSADDVYLPLAVVVTVPDAHTASCRNLTVSDVYGYLQLYSATAKLNIYGNVSFAPKFQLLGSGTIGFAGAATKYVTGSTFTRSAITLEINGGTTVIGHSVVFSAVNVLSGTVNLSGLNCTTLTLTGGTFNAGSAGLTAETLATSGSTARTLTLGSGTITLTGATAVNFASITGLTMTANTATIAINGSGAAQSINFGGATVHNISLANASATSFTFTGNVTANRVASARSGAYTVNINVGITITTTEWAVTGSAGNIVSLRCTTPDSQGNITKVGGGTSSTAYMSVKDIHAEPALTFVSTQSTDDGNNTNWFFEAFYKINTLLYGSPM